MDLLEKDFPNRVWERELYNPLVGTSMLELGNKVKGKMVYKDVFERLGFRHVSIDMNGRNGALALDLAKPIDLGTFDMVTNLGTTEHVSVNDYSGQVQCWRTIVDAMHIGSVFISITPMAECPRWLRHGRWQPKPEFFDELARLNGMEVERCYTDSRELQYARLMRRKLTDFTMPEVGMYENRGRIRMDDCS